MKLTAVFNAVFVCLTLAASPAVLAQRPADRGPQLKWEHFRRNAGDSPERYRLSDDDIIRIKVEERAVPKDEVEFVLVSDLNVTWWKGLEVIYYAPPRPGLRFTLPWEDPQRAILNSLYTQDVDHGPKSMRVRTSALKERPHALVFLKAKAFGAHTPMYFFQLYQPTAEGWQPDTTKLGGRRITFIWEKD